LRPENRDGASTIDNDAPIGLCFDN